MNRSLNDEPTLGSPGSGRAFPPTRWSLVIDSGAGRERALEEVCTLYWFPIYAFLRHSGISRPDAEDVTQSFFARLLEQGAFAKISPEGGRLRSYLLAALKNHLANWHRHKTAKRRGGGQEHVPVDGIDFSDAEQRFGQIAGSGVEVYWALQIVRLAGDCLEREMRESGRGKLFETLRPMLVPDGQERSYEEAAELLGMGEGALRVAVHRLRERFRQFLRKEVADTVRSTEVVDDELTAIYQTLARQARIGWRN